MNETAADIIVTLIPRITNLFIMGDTCLDENGVRRNFTPEERAKFQNTLNQQNLVSFVFRESFLKNQRKIFRQHLITTLQLNDQSSAI